MTNPWTRAELESAFQRYQETVEEIATSRDWERFADIFTEDATYEEHTYGNFSGREEIRRWIVETMTTFPGSAMPHFPITWYVIDEERGRVVCDVWNALEDPGDGDESHGCSNITILTYAGNDQWSREEDIYNPARFLRATRKWAKIAESHGRLSDEGRAWLAAFG